MNKNAIKLTLESNDKYEKARQDMIKAADSLKELSPQQCQKLVQEFFGYEALIQICKFMQQNNGGGYHD